MVYTGSFERRPNYLMTDMPCQSYRDLIIRSYFISMFIRTIFVLLIENIEEQAALLVANLIVDLEILHRLRKTRYLLPRTAPHRSQSMAISTWCTSMLKTYRSRIVSSRRSGFPPALMKFSSVSSTITPNALCMTFGALVQMSVSDVCNTKRLIYHLRFSLGLLSGSHYLRMSLIEIRPDGFRNDPINLRF